MTTPDVERVARAICYSVEGDESRWEWYDEEARAAMAATREIDAEALRKEADDYPSTDYGRWVHCAADWLQQRANDVKGQTDD